MGRAAAERARAEFDEERLVDRLLAIYREATAA
jgi:glycosyltransferase involved in cell wall biosynthesis